MARTGCKSVTLTTNGLAFLSVVNTSTDLPSANGDTSADQQLRAVEYCRNRMRARTRSPFHTPGHSTMSPSFGMGKLASTSMTAPPPPSDAAVRNGRCRLFFTMLRYSSSSSGGTYGLIPRGVNEWRRRRWRLLLLLLLTLTLGVVRARCPSKTREVVVERRVTGTPQLTVTCTQQLNASTNSSSMFGFVPIVVFFLSFFFGCWAYDLSKQIY